MTDPHRDRAPAAAPRWRAVLWGGSACLLMLPGLAMQFTDELRWDAADFLAFGALLAAACGGYELAASWTGRFKAGDWTLLPGASVRWQDAKMVDYYYGVRASEALLGRAAYSADAALTPDVSLLATRKLGERWSVYARASHAWLPSEVTDSPLVDRNGNTSLFLGVGYSLD